MKLLPLFLIVNCDAEYSNARKRPVPQKSQSFFEPESDARHPKEQKAIAPPIATLKETQMRNPIKTGIIAAAALAAATLFSASHAFAACAYSEWSNIIHGHPVATMTGRNCNGQHALKAVGINGHDFGWTPMTVTGLNTFSATFVGDNASNDVHLTIFPLMQLMNANITTNYNSGVSKNWGGKFKLDSIH